MSVFKEKIACLGSQRLREHAIFELCNQISSQKRKIGKIIFACSYGAQDESFMKKKNWSKISWHTPFKL